MPFEPNYRITPRTATHLMRIEAARQAVEDLPITSSVLAGLRETARLFSTHYSTMIEGNRLAREEVSSLIERRQALPRPGAQTRPRSSATTRRSSGSNDSRRRAADVTDLQVRTLHALVMAGGKAVKKATPYRGGQNVIRDGGSRRIVYMPPEASDVPRLMGELLDWLRRSEREGVPCPIRAGIAHYQFATIHPYYDGNGRTARLLTTLILHRGGYDLKGLYSLEEYYARDLAGLLRGVGGRAVAQLLPGPGRGGHHGVGGLLLRGHGRQLRERPPPRREAADRGSKDDSAALRRLDPRQRRALELFRRSIVITSRDVEALFGVSQRTARNILSSWVRGGFVVVADPARKTRSYRLSPEYEGLGPSSRSLGSRIPTLALLATLRHEGGSPPRIATPHIPEWKELPNSLPRTSALFG